MNTKLQKGVSIILCCYNSSSRILRTLAYLANQKGLTGIKWEIVLVDNNSNDETCLVASKEWEEYKCAAPLRIVKELQQGLSFARFKGARAALYDIVAFCDDDNWLDDNYVFTAWGIMEESERLGIAGGWSDCFMEQKKPHWFSKFQHAYVVGKPLLKTGLANSRKYLTGAGMVVRRELFIKLQALGFESVLSDRKGRSVSSGGDSELCLLALYLGYDLYYDDRLHFTHYITSNRLNWPYCVKMISKGFAEPQIHYYLYDYCHSKIMNGETPDFNYAYKRNIRKPFKALIDLFKKDLFSVVKYSLISMPGSKAEITIKSHYNKLVFTLRNKKRLREDFQKISNLMMKMKAMKESLTILETQCEE